jgi:hypothetical protein
MTALGAEPLFLTPGGAPFHPPRRAFLIGVDDGKREQTNDDPFAHRKPATPCQAFRRPELMAAGSAID